MDVSKALLVVCITLFVVILINLAIYFSIARGQGVSQIELMRRAARRARNPWEQEDSDLSELSRLVADFKGKGDEEDA